MLNSRPKLATNTKDTLEKARQLYLNEEADAAFDLMTALHAEDPHHRVCRFLSRLLVHFGRDDEARAMLGPVIGQVYEPGFWELALLDSGLSKVMWSDANRFVYFPVPKCGSTSVKNAIWMLEGGENLREDIHKNIDHLYRWVNRSELPDLAPGGWRFAIVRDPIERVRSYHRGNIIARQALVKDAGGRDSFYGLSTTPSYEEFLEKFDAYRRVFVTARHHVEPLSRYIGTDPGLFHWLGNLSRTADLLGKLAEHTGHPLPAIREMQSPAGEKSFSAAEEVIRPFYDDDYRHYSAWF